VCSPQGRRRRGRAPLDLDLASPANHSNNRSVKLVGGEAVTDGGGEGGAEEVPVGFVAGDRPAAMGCLGWGGGRVARI
jgi:hypothetical protein